MGKVLLGFAAGIALTALATLLLTAETETVPSETEEDTISRSLPDRTEAADARSSQDSSGESARQNGFEDTAVVDATRKLTADQLRNLTRAELEAAIEAASGTQQYGALLGERLRRDRIERFSAEPPPTHPITLPPEFAWLTDDPDPRHEVLQREPVDPEWSATTEAQIATFLAENPEIAQKYGQPFVTCRTSGCELAFVAYGVDETAFQVMQSGMFFDIDEHEWADQFVNPRATLFNARTQGDATTILWHLIKTDD